MATLKASAGRDKGCQVNIREYSNLTRGELEDAESPLISLSHVPFHALHKAASYSSSHLQTFSRIDICECWPRSAIELLTGGQKLDHRLLLLWHLENLVKRSPTVEKDNSHLEFERRDSLGQRLHRRLSSESWARRSPHTLVTSGLLTFGGLVKPKAAVGLQLTTSGYSIPEPDKKNGYELL